MIKIFQQINQQILIEHVLIDDWNASFELEKYIGLIKNLARTW